MHESAEMYLETIYVLTQKSSSVRNIDVAEHMGFSKPSVTRGVGILKQAGYVVSNNDGFLSLTPEGRTAAEKIFERHTVLSAFLASLGVAEVVASEDACRIEHIISDESFEAIKKHLGR